MVYVIHIKHKLKMQLFMGDSNASSMKMFCETYDLTNLIKGNQHAIRISLVHLVLLT